jgi:type I restriction enzyme R subunit
MAFTEDNISQIPAIKLLITLGYTYLTPTETIELRGGKNTAVILEPILREQLKKINRIKIGSKTAEFSDTNIEKSIHALKDIPLVEGLVNASNEAYNMLLFGHALEQSLEGDKKSHTVQYIDWENPTNNVFHVTEEFEVMRTGRKDTYRPDIVVFVNGIPLVIIECKSPTIKEPIREAISQHIRNQQENAIQSLYVYSQILLSTSLVEAKYATTNTKEEFWAVWKEKDDEYLSNLDGLVNHQLPNEVETKIFFQSGSRSFYDHVAYKEKYSTQVSPSAQDILIYGTLSQERLLSLIKDFILFEAGIIKKIARFQQFFSIEKIIDRVKSVRNGKRLGGVIWHTQGSGKSLTMAMLARKIRDTVKNPQIILVTDRIDLDRQITTTLQKVEVEVINAHSGKQLVHLLRDNKDVVTTTIINKFQAAVNSLSDNPLTSPNIFVLIDEAHRTQYGIFNVNMEKVLPNACFIVFTGTPLMKSQKNTAAKFGGIIDTYTITEAVEDGAIVPILYEGRLAVQDVNQAAVDKGFDRVAEDLSDYDKGELKKKMSNAGLISKTDQNIYEIAYDISQHFSSNWGHTDTRDHTGFRGMVVTPDKPTAVKYKRAFDLINKVKTEIVMSAADSRESNDDVHSSESDEVVKYYELLKTKYGNDIDNAVITQYEHGESIELLIVIEKLLTGFDVPQTIVMYLCKKLKEHTLLQAIARVNRVYPGKDYGYVIDYAGIMEELQEAMDTYATAEDGFDPKEIAEALTSIKIEIAKLPVAYEELIELFKTIKNKKDISEFVALLADEALREEFYKKFSVFARILKIALSSIDFHNETSKEDMNKYRDALGDYAKIRSTVNSIYQDKVNFSQYEKQLQKLLDQHVVTEEIIRLVDPISILNTELFEEELEKLIGPRAKAEKIAAATTKHISVNIDMDPVLYKKLSELIIQTIADMRAARISELEALEKLKQIKEEAIGKSNSEIPEEVKDKNRKISVFRLFKGEEKLKEQEVVATAFFDQLLSENELVDWEKRSDIINKIELEFGDYLMDVFHFTMDEADELTKKCIEIAIANK